MDLGCTSLGFAAGTIPGAKGGRQGGNHGQLPPLTQTPTLGKGIQPKGMQEMKTVSHTATVYGFLFQE